LPFAAASKKKLTRAQAGPMPVQGRGHVALHRRRLGPRCGVADGDFQDMDDGFTGLRHMMVDCQLRTYDVTDRAVLAAADAVPREAFLPQELSHLAYLDQSVPLPGTGRALMAPMVIARMIQTLELEPGEDALEYGGGSGYGAALMARMGARATLWEPDAAALALAGPALRKAAATDVAITAERPSDESFDAILVSGACETIPEMLFGLLRQGGRLIALDGLGRSARVKLYQKSGETVSGRPVFDAAAPALAEFRRPPAFVF
jgi:protein-L-isoaspartate(D-aspartate) O-methyltransferase